MATSTNLNCEMLRPCHQSSITFTVMKSRNHIGKLIKKITMNTFIENGKGELYYGGGRVFEAGIIAQEKNIIEDLYFYFMQNY